MEQWCLKANGNIVLRRSFVPLTTDQLNNNEEILKRNVFTNCIRTPFPIKMEWAYAMDVADKFPNQAQLLCRVLGPTKNYGNKMAQWCLKVNGKMVPSISVVPLTTSHPYNNKEILKQNLFTNCIRKGYGDSIIFPPFPIKMEDVEFVPYKDDGEKKYTPIDS